MKKLLNFHPDKFPFFYGYIILFAGAIGAIMSAPGQTIGVSVFTDHLIFDFKITRVELSTVYMIGTIISAFLLTFGGKLYDKYGARIIAPIAALGLGFFLLYLTQINLASKFFGKKTSIDSYYFLIVLLVIGFLGIRFFGQGMLTMVSRNMVMKWFDKKRGLASAVFGIALVLGFSVAPKIFSSLIDGFNWQVTWQLTAVTVGGVFVVFALFFFRDNPIKYRLKPDGNIKINKKTNQSKKQKIIATGRDFELKEAIKTYSFWVFTLTMTLFALYVTAFTFHIEDIFISSGHTKELAISTFIPTAIIAVIFQLLGGWASDYIKLKYILYFSLIGLIISMAGTLLLKSGTSIWLIIFGNAMAQGVFGILSSVTWPRFFGIKNLGAISGFAISWTVAGSAIGPLLFSYSKKLSGNYSASLLICVIIGAILLLMATKADNVSEKSKK